MLSPEHGETLSMTTCTLARWAYCRTNLHITNGTPSTHITTRTLCTVQSDLPAYWDVVWLTCLLVRLCSGRERVWEGRVQR